MKIVRMVGTQYPEDLDVYRTQAFGNSTARRHTYALLMKTRFGVLKVSKVPKRELPGEILVALLPRMPAQQVPNRPTKAGEVSHIAAVGCCGLLVLRIFHLGSPQKSGLAVCTCWEYCFQFQVQGYCPLCTLNTL